MRTSMGLPAEQFREIIKSLKSDSSNRRSMEKRQGPRVGLRARLTICRSEQGKPRGGAFEVWVRDLSADGIGLVHSERFEAGQELIAHFPLGSREMLRVAYKVAHCKMLSKTLYCVGARLSRILNEARPTTRAA